MELSQEQKALILGTLANTVTAEKKLATALFSADYGDGDKRVFRSPLDDAPLGRVERTAPKAEWQVTDADALASHLSEHEGCMAQTTAILVPGIGWHDVDPRDEIALVLREHAPHLVADEQRVSQDAVDAAVEQSKATGQAAAPGITRVRPGGVLRVVPDKEAPAAIGRLVRAGLLDWSAVLALPTPTEAREAS